MTKCQLFILFQNKAEGLKKLVTCYRKAMKDEKIHFIPYFFKKFSFWIAVLRDWSLPKETHYIHIFITYKNKAGAC